MTILIAWAWLSLLPVEPSSSRAPQVQQGCPIVSVDSVQLAGGPVFQACDVDKAARRKGRRLTPRYEMSMGQSCVMAVIQFVVETDGSVNPKTSRVINTNDDMFAGRVVRDLRLARYEPAEKGGAPVRQVVIDTVAIRQVAAVPGGAGNPSSFGPPCQ